MCQKVEMGTTTGSERHIRRMAVGRCREYSLYSPAVSPSVRLVILLEKMQGLHLDVFVCIFSLISGKEGIRLEIVRRS